MNSKLRYIVFYPFLMIVFLACSPALYVPTLADSQKVGVSTNSLVIGRQIYVNNCSSCHSLYRPEHLTKSEWAKVMPVMQNKAKIKDDEKELIFNYLIVRCKPL